MLGYSFIFYLVIIFGLEGTVYIYGQSTNDHVRIDCKNKTIDTIPSYNATILPKSIELFACVIDSPVVIDLKKINVSTDALQRIYLTYVITHTALDHNYMEGLTMNTLTIKSHTELPAMRFSLVSLKNITNLELTNVDIPPVLPHGLKNLSLIGIDYLPVPLMNCENLKQFNINNWNLNYIYEGFLANCSNLKTVRIEFGKNRFMLPNLFIGSNISLDYLEIHDNLKLRNTTTPLQLSSYSFAGISELKKLNLSYNDISSLSNDTFTNIHGLQVLDLSHNKLFDFDVDHVTSLRTLNLSENPLSDKSALRIFDERSAFYPALEYVSISASEKANKWFKNPWTVISKKNEKASNHKTNATENIVIVRCDRNPKLCPKKMWSYLPCVAISIVSLVIVGFVCMVIRLKKMEKCKLENEESKPKNLKHSMERRNVDADKCYESSQSWEITHL